MISHSLFKFLLPLLKSLGVAALTPVLEKNVVKTLAMDSPLVVSMSRLIAMVFAAVVLREYWQTGIDGWPDATVGIATVIALPMMNAIERAKPDDVMAITRLLLARMRGPEPSKLDDHRID
jgi:hypothetical protein